MYCCPVQRLLQSYWEISHHYRKTGNQRILVPGGNVGNHFSTIKLDR